MVVPTSWHFSGSQTFERNCARRPTGWTAFLRRSRGSDAPNATRTTGFKTFTTAPIADGRSVTSARPFPVSRRLLCSAVLAKNRGQGCVAQSLCKL